MSYNNREETLALELLEFQSKNLNDFIDKIQKYQEEHPNFNFPFGKECDGDCTSCSHRDNSCALKEYCKKDGTLKIQFEKWKSRKFFTVNDDVPPDLRKNLVNHLITCENDPSFLSGAQNSFTMNFDIISGEIRLRDHIHFLSKHIRKKLSVKKYTGDQISKFLEELKSEGLLREGNRTKHHFTLKECIHKDRPKPAKNLYYIIEKLTVEDFDKQFDNKFPETAKKDSKQTKKNKS